jgi:hypothetical protein
MEQEARITTSRILACALAWIFALLLSKPDYLPALLLDPRMILGIPVSILYTPLFPVGLLVAFHDTGYHDSKEAGEWILVTLWIVYVALTSGALIARQKLASWSLYVILCALLMLNVLGCREFWSQVSGTTDVKALDAVRPTAPYVSDFVRLFPNAELKYTDLSGGLGFDLTVDLYQHYELGLQLPVRFDFARSNVIGYAEPRFHLYEIARQEGRGRSYNPAGGLDFGSAEWKKIVESGGDFGAIGYVMKTNQPVKGFEDRRNPKLH